MHGDASRNEGGSDGRSEAAERDTGEDGISRRGVLGGTAALTSGFVASGLAGADVSGAEVPGRDVPERATRPGPPDDLPAAADAPGALFHAGGAVRSVDPPSPELATHMGGYGTCDDCPTTRVRAGDQLSARAFATIDESYDSVVAAVVVDVQGWFAGYKDNPFGVTPLREEVAATLSKPRDEGGIGVPTAPGDIIVQGTHSHASPDIVGVWGDVNEQYLEYVYEQTKRAIVAAARNAEPAVLEVATADASAPISATRDEGNSYEGWPKDETLVAIRARDARTGNDQPGTGRTLATYATMPLHENIISGADTGELSSGYFGSAARWLESEWGGTAIVGPATLGDQVAPMQNDGATLPDGTPRSYQVVDRLGALVGNLAAGGIRDSGRILQDGTVDAAEQYVVVPVTNPALLAANCAPGGGEAAGIPIQRSCQPPYGYGAAAGTWFTALRLGEAVVASEPGEAFPQVSRAIRDGFPDAETVAIAGQAQDQLGYYYPPWVAPFTQVYSANHLIFNISQSLADENVQAHTANSQSLGLGLEPQAMSPLDIDPCRSGEAGVQVIVYPNPREGERHVDVPDPEDGGIVVPLAVHPEDARLDGELPANPAGVGKEDAGKPVVTYGDGSGPETFPPTQGAGTYRFHEFPGPGTYDVTARLPEADAEWTQTVHLGDETHLVESASYPETRCKTVEEEQ